MEDKDEVRESKGCAVALSSITIVMAICVIALCYCGYAYSGSVGAMIHEYECAAPTPKRYKVVFNGDDYAVKIIDQSSSSGEYLWVRSTGFIWTHYEPLSTFPDSCKAKAVMFEYIRQETEDKNYGKSFK